MEDFIAKVTGLPMDGIKFTKQKRISNVVYKKFPKMEEEEKNLEKSRDFFDMDQIKTI